MTPAEAALAERAELKSEDRLESAIREVIEDLRPYLRIHDGDMNFVGLKNGIVQVHMQGACCGCPSADLTLKGGIERIIVEKFPTVRGVTADNA